MAAHLDFQILLQKNIQWCAKRVSNEQVYNRRCGRTNEALSFHRLVYNIRDDKKVREAKQLGVLDDKPARCRDVCNKETRSPETSFVSCKTNPPSIPLICQPDFRLLEKSSQDDENKGTQHTKGNASYCTLRRSFSISWLWEQGLYGHCESVESGTRVSNQFAHPNIHMRERGPLKASPSSSHVYMAGWDSAKEHWERSHAQSHEKPMINVSKMH